MTSITDNGAGQMINQWMNALLLNSIDMTPLEKKMIEVLIQKIKNVRLSGLPYPNDDEFPMKKERFAIMREIIGTKQDHAIHDLNEIESILKILTLPNNE